MEPSIEKTMDDDTQSNSDEPLSTTDSPTLPPQQEVDYSAQRVKLPPLRNQGQLISLTPEEKNGTKTEIKQQSSREKNPVAGKNQASPKKTGRIVSKTKPAQKQKNEGSQNRQQVTSRPVDKGKAIALQKEGTQMARKKQWNKAGMLLKQSLQYDPTNVSSLNNLGIVLRKQNQLNEALKLYQTALTVSPGTALTHKNYAVLLEKIAIREYRQYLDLNPNANDVEKVKKRADWLEKKR